MRYVPTANIALDKRKAKIVDDKKCYPLKIRITFARDSRFYQLDKDYYLTDEDFSVLQTSRKSEILPIRMKANKELAKANKIIDELNDYFTFEEFKRIYNSKTKSSKDVYSVYEEYINTLKDNNQFKTAGLYTTSLNSLKEYKKSLHFRDITTEFLEKYARTFNKKIIPSAYVRNLRTIYNYAISKRLAKHEDYPFGKYAYKVPNTTRRNISLSDYSLKLLYQYYQKHKNDKIELKLFALDIFLFSYNCNGMNFSDIARFKQSHIRMDLNGDRYIDFSRGKTINRSTAPKIVPIYLNELSEEIISRYITLNTPSDYIFPIITIDMSLETAEKRISDRRSKITKKLKEIAEELSIEPFSLNYARHTFITDKKNEGYSYEVINDSIGNKSIEMTRGYVDASKLDVLKQISQENLKKFVGNKESDI